VDHHHVARGIAFVALQLLETVVDALEQFFLLGVVQRLLIEKRPGTIVLWRGASA